MDTSQLSEGTRKRLKRIQDLKGYNEEDALQYSISLAWMVTETRNRGKKSGPTFNTS